jgi:hypothetical protein
MKTVSWPTSLRFLVSGMLIDVQYTVHRCSDALSLSPAAEYHQRYVLFCDAVLITPRDSYEMVKEHETIEALHERAKIMVDMEVLCEYRCISPTTGCSLQ